MKILKSLILFMLISINIIEIKGFDENANEEYQEAEYTALEDVLRRVDPEINKTVECVRQKILEKKLDPFKFPLIPLFIKNDMIHAQMMLYNIQLHGLASFEFTEAAIILLPTKVVIKMKLDNIGFLIKKYDGSLRLQNNMLHLYGKGAFNANLTDFSLDVTVKLSFSILSRKIQIKNIDFNMNLFKAAISITGLFNDDFMSRIISNQLSKALTTIMKENENGLNTLIQRTANDLSKTKINPFLKKHTVTQLKRMMEGKDLCKTASEYIEQVDVSYVQKLIEGVVELKVQDFVSQLSENYKYDID